MMYIMNKSKSKKKISKKRRKNTKNKNKTIFSSPTTLRKCHNYCELEYSPGIEKQFKKMARRQNLPYNPTLADRDKRIRDCKENFCNTGCLSDIHNKKILSTKLKSRGLISYCTPTNLPPPSMV